MLVFVSTADYVSAVKSPADEYYQNLGSGNDTPADSYYERHLRASGPEPGSPGGPPAIDDGNGGEIDGGFVGGEPVPVSDASIFNILLMGGIFFIYKLSIKRITNKNIKNYKI